MKKKMNELKNKNMRIIIKKSFNGHDIIINGNIVMWIIGSKKNANVELKRYLNERILL